MFAPSVPFASAALRCDLVVTGLTRGQESTFGQHKGREIAGPKENLFVSTLLTHGVQAGIVMPLNREGLNKVRVTVKKWGNSAAVRLPTSVMKATQLEVDEVVEVHEDGGRIVIEPVRTRRYELSELLKGITRKNQHREVDFGPAVGGEIW